MLFFSLFPFFSFSFFFFPFFSYFFPFFPSFFPQAHRALLWYAPGPFWAPLSPGPPR